MVPTLRASGLSEHESHQVAGQIEADLVGLTNSIAQLLEHLG